MKINNIPYIICTPIMRIIFRLYYNPKIVNKNNIPKKGPIIIISNHKHLLDQCLSITATHRPINYLAKKEYFDGKFAWFFKMFGCISVNRQTHDKDATQKAIKVLKENGVIGLFPEGTRNKTNDIILLPFKFGAVSLAQKTGAKIIPSCITGDYKFRSKNLIVTYGTPITIKEDENLEIANKNLEQAVEKLLKENLTKTKRTLEEELNSRNQDQKKEHN